MQYILLIYRQLQQRHRYREVKPQISADINQLKNCVGRQHYVNTFTFKKNMHNNSKIKYIESLSKQKTLKMNKLSRKFICDIKL